ASAPLVFPEVLDPTRHKTPYIVSFRSATDSRPFGAIASTLKQSALRTFHRPCARSLPGDTVSAAIELLASKSQTPPVQSVPSGHLCPALPSHVRPSPHSSSNE